MGEANGYCFMQDGAPAHTSKKNYSSVKSLTKSLQQEWKKLSEDQIRKICAAAPNRLKAIAEKEGHHVE